MRRSLEAICRQLEFKNGFFVDCVGRKGGLMLLWSDDTDLSIKSFSQDHIDVVVQPSTGEHGGSLVFMDTLRLVNVNFLENYCVVYLN